MGHGSRLLLWSIWLVLLLLLAGQIYLLSSRRIVLPEPVRRIVAERLAEHGLRLDYQRGLMDLSGHLILEKVRFGPNSSASPLATADYLYLYVDPWDLLAGSLDLREARIGGLALQAPSGPALIGSEEVLADRVDLSITPVGNEIELSYLTGYIGNLPVEAHGRFHLPGLHAVGGGKSAGGVLSSGWNDLARHLRTARSLLAAADGPLLHLRLEPGRVEVSVEARSIDLGALPSAPKGRLTDVRLRTTVPLSVSSRTPVTVFGTLDRLELPSLDGEARGLVFQLRTNGALASPSADLQLGSVRWRKIETGPLIAAISRPTAENAAANIALALAGGVWSIQAGLDDGTAGVSLDGFVDSSTLAFAGSLIDRDLSSLLDPARAAPLHARASFAPGWKLVEASGRLHSGSVRVGGAQLDETGTEFTYDGTRVLCDNLVLRQGASLAHGSYEMDTRTMDFRFLLTGGLRPMGISSWFHEWWTNFWATFDFSHSLPDADVDVQGRWGDLTATNVFVQAAGARTALKGVEFDRVRTRLFLRPHWFDILHFEVAREARGAEGHLARSMDLDQNTWTRMDFTVESTLPLTTISQLFPDESAELLAPYDFTTPPSLHLHGHVTSAASSEGKHEVIDVALTSSGAMTYHDFPLSDLVVQARVHDNLIDLPSLSVTFAGGQATGDANLWGPPDARRLAFNITLTGANLGTVVQTVSTLQPSPAPVSEKEAEAARLRQQRLEGGRLDFKLKAEGVFTDFYSFKGDGIGTITNAELGQLNLFGPVSEMLRGTFLNFSSFSLTTVDAPFKLNGDQVRFRDLRVSGPSALLLAKGTYQLRGGDLDFTTKIHPFDESTSLFGSAASFVFTPFSKVFEVKLQGTLSKPSWIFAYGPSRLLNTLTGNDGAPKETTSPSEKKTP
ncbi:MAG: AsmA-like C-terminal region-containing protein [Rariglobus sp.]